VAYEKEKDKLIDHNELDLGEGKFLQVSLFSYNGGEPKLQISRRYTKQDGTVGYGNMGRLNKKELEWVREVICHVLDGSE